VVTLPSAYFTWLVLLVMCNHIVPFCLTIYIHYQFGDFIFSDTIIKCA